MERIKNGRIFLQDMTDGYVLNSYSRIPCIGFGTWQTPNGEVATNAVKAAIEAGYRHIDAAANYKNEEAVGKGIKDSGISREDLFVTSKVWVKNRGYAKTLASLKKTLKDLQLDYLDLFLMHLPAPSGEAYGLTDADLDKYPVFPNWREINSETWRAMEKAYEEGLVRAIGVSNFMPHHFITLIANESIKPMVNQIEMHPGMPQNEIVQYCREYHMIMEAYSPIGTGKLLKDPGLIAMAEKYGKSVAQLCIRWCLQKGVVPLPKSINPERIAENTKVFDFEISDEDMNILDHIPNVGWSGTVVDTVKWNYYI